MMRSFRFLPVGPFVGLVLIGGLACSSVSQLRPSIPAAAPPVTTSAAQPATDKVAPAANGAQAASSDQALPDTSAQLLDRMVIRTSQLTVEVRDIDSALAQARAIAGKAGGFVSASNSHYESDHMVADLTLEVRSDSADSAISDLRSLGKVTAENTGSQDVTDEYVDLDANLRNLQASETAILKLMDRATQIQDVLSLQRELTNVRGQIERIQGRKTYLERRTDMATITLSLRLPPVGPVGDNSAWDPAATLLRGWQASLTVLRVITEVILVVVAFSWWLIPFLGVGAYLLVQHRRARAPA